MGKTNDSSTSFSSGVSVQRLGGSTTRLVIDSTDTVVKVMWIVDDRIQAFEEFAHSGDVRRRVEELRLLASLGGKRGE